MSADATIFDLGSLPGNNARISTTKCGPLRLNQIHRGKSLGRLSLQGYAGATFGGWRP
jgi:hypothetical protein